MRNLVHYALAGLAILAAVPAAGAAKRTGEALAAARACGQTYNSDDARCEDKYRLRSEVNACKDRALIRYNACLDRADTLPGGRAMQGTQPGQAVPGGGTAGAEREPAKRTPQVTGGTGAGVDKGTPTPTTSRPDNEATLYQGTASQGTDQPSRKASTKKGSSATKQNAE